MCLWVSENPHVVHGNHCILQTLACGMHAVSWTHISQPVFLGHTVNTVHVTIFSAFVNQLTDDVTTGYFQHDGARCHMSYASMREIKSFFWRLSYLETSLADISRFNLIRFFPIGCTEGKCLHEASHDGQPQRKHSPGDCSHSCGLVTTCICYFGVLHPVLHGQWRQPISASCVMGCSFTRSEVCTYKI